MTNLAGAAGDIEGVGATGRGYRSGENRVTAGEASHLALAPPIVGNRMKRGHMVGFHPIHEKLRRDHIHTLDNESERLPPEFQGPLPKPSQIFAHRVQRVFRGPIEFT